jgi:hypothetical protein
MGLIQPYFATNFLIIRKSSENFSKTLDFSIFI